MTRHPGYFDILLRAPEGLYSTREHWFELEAAPLDEHSPVVHLRNSYEYGVLANIFMKSYFGTIGRLNTRCSFHLVRKKITLRAQSWILKNQLQEAAGK